MSNTLMGIGSLPNCLFGVDLGLERQAIERQGAGSPVSRRVVESWQEGERSEVEATELFDIDGAVWDDDDADFDLL